MPRSAPTLATHSARSSGSRAIGRSFLVRHVCSHLFGSSGSPGGSIVGTSHGANRWAASGPPIRSGLSLPRCEDPLGPLPRRDRGRQTAGRQRKENHVLDLGGLGSGIRALRTFECTAPCDWLATAIPRVTSRVVRVSRGPAVSTSRASPSWAVATAGNRVRKSEHTSGRQSATLLSPLIGTSASPTTADAGDRTVKPTLGHRIDVSRPVVGSPNPGAAPRVHLPGPWARIRISGH